LEEAKLVIGGSYEMKDAFRLGATFRRENQAVWDGLVPDNITEGQNAYGGRHESSQLVAELRLLMIKNLTAVVVGNFDKLEDFEDNGDIFLSETFAYKFNDGFNAGFDAVQFFYNRDNTDMDPGLLFRLWGTYAFGKAVPRLDLTYFMGGRSNTADGGNGSYHRKGFTAFPSKKEEDNDRSVFSIRPSVKVNLDSRTFIEIGDVINMDSAKDKAFADRKDGELNKDSRLTNVFYIDFRWNF
jgi:hypothetical protein